jgi:hypothetical protein
MKYKLCICKTSALIGCILYIINEAKIFRTFLSTTDDLNTSTCAREIALHTLKRDEWILEKRGAAVAPPWTAQISQVNR